MNLDRCAEVLLWSQGIFGLSEGSLESLVNRAPDFDFAILVLTPDDLTSSRGADFPSPRDNVVFELGLFMGVLGRDRTFIVYDRTAPIKLPSDLAGVTPATYYPPSSGSLQSAVGACSSTIQSQIEKLGVRVRAEQLPIDPGVQFRVMSELLEVNALQFIILMGESGITLRREGPYQIGVRYEYYGNDSENSGQMGHGYFTVEKFCNRLADAELLTIDLRGRVGLSERGRAFAEWLSSSGKKAAYFWSDLGHWGERPSSMSQTEHVTNAPRNWMEFQDRARRGVSPQSPSKEGQT